MIEATFIGEGEERHARQRGHTHLSEIAELLEERADEIACEAIILKHFSMKIKPLEAAEAALRMIPPMFHERVYLMCDLPKSIRGKSLSEIAWHGV